MSSIETRVVSNYQTAEYGKFVQLTNNTEFPAVSVTRFVSPNAIGVPPVSAVEVYPKYGVITYDARLGIANSLPFGDNSAIDSFGRLRVSEPKTLFDSKHVTNKSPHTYDQAISGTGDVLFIDGDSLVKLTTSAANDFAIRQTFTHFNYQPGKSIQVMCTGLFQPQTNIIKRIGLFQGSSIAPFLPEDGIYLESSNDTISFHVLKTRGTAQHLSAAQADWNVDKLDGTGPSGVTIDFTKAQIITFDYEWLGLGRIRCGFIVGGQTYYVHYFDNVNALTAPYMKSPNHPIRYEIRQIGVGMGELKQICSTVMIEGGEENVGVSLTAELSGGISVDQTLRPLLILRLAPQSVDLVGIIKSINIYNKGNTAVIYKLIKNPDIQGNSLTFRNIDGYTDLQYAEGTASHTLSGGFELISGYASSGNSSVAVGAGTVSIASELARFGSKVDGTPVNYVIAARGLGGTSSPVYASTNLELRA